MESKLSNTLYCLHIIISTRSTYEGKKIILSSWKEIICQVNKYYDLVTSFYEYGWGESFHFAPRWTTCFYKYYFCSIICSSWKFICFYVICCRWKGESLQESIKRHEHFLALQLGLKPGQKVLWVLFREFGLTFFCFESILSYCTCL